MGEAFIGFGDNERGLMFQAVSLDQWDLAQMNKID